MIKIVSVVGARPQFVKASVLRKLFMAAPDFEEILIHTGQHYDFNMSDLFFDELSIAAPDIKLEIAGGTQASMTGRMMTELETYFSDIKPDACLVYGDTNSTLAAALAAAKIHVPVIHVEAGLRSFNKKMPEEINRILTDHVSDLLFSPTQSGIDNLQSEGLHDNIHNVGDIMYDATLEAIKMVKTRPLNLDVDLTTSKLAICTLHRAENTDNKDRLSDLIYYLNAVAEAYNIILPLHPRTKKALQTHGLSLGRIQPIDPIGYLDMQLLLSHADIVFTDSGGLQKEAYFHQTPCVTLRTETEWIELIEAGWNRLWTVPAYKARKPITDYGNGRAGKKILDIIRAHFSS